MKKTILIKPAYDFYENESKFREVPQIAPDMALLSLATYLKENHVLVEIIDVQIDYGIALNQSNQDYIDSQILNDLMKIKSEISWLGLSLFVSSNLGLNLAEKISKQLEDIPIILGGYFPSTAYDVLLRKYPFIAAIVQGDGEKASKDISEAIDQGEPFPNPNIPNLIWMKENVIIKNNYESMSPQELSIMDFSHLKNPDSYSLINLLTSRGCPYTCGFCLERKMRPYSNFSIEWVKKQIENLEKNMKGDHIFLHDTSFIIPNSVSQEKFSILENSKFKFAIECRLDTISEVNIEQLNRIGVELIYFGFESASSDSLLRMQKISSYEKALYYLKNAMIILKKCFELGITPVLGVMLNYPGDTLKDFEQTLNFVQDVSTIYGETTENMEMKGGFLFSPSITRIEIGSDLCDDVMHNYKDVILEDNQDLIGQRTVLSPSKGMDLDCAKTYSNQITHISQQSFNPLILDRFKKYLIFPIENIINQSSRFHDRNGIISLK